MRTTACPLACLQEPDDEQATTLREIRSPAKARPAEPAPALDQGPPGERVTGNAREGPPGDGGGSPGERLGRSDSLAGVGLKFSEPLLLLGEPATKRWERPLLHSLSPGPRNRCTDAGTAASTSQ